MNDGHDLPLYYTISGLLRHHVENHHGSLQMTSLHAGAILKHWRAEGPRSKDQLAKAVTCPSGPSLDTMPRYRLEPFPSLRPNVRCCVGRTNKCLKVATLYITTMTVGVNMHNCCHTGIFMDWHFNMRANWHYCSQLSTLEGLTRIAHDFDETQVWWLLVFRLLCHCKA